MSGLLPFFVAGLGFLFLAAIESLSLSLRSQSQSQSPFLLLRLRFTSSLFLSSLFLLSSLHASLSSPSHDPLGASLPLSSLAAASLFLLYSLSGLLSLPPLSPYLPLPSSFLDLLATFSLGLEFLYFYLRRKDLDGIENRYFDLLLVPILLSILSTLFTISSPRSAPPRLARAAGLALQGTWFLQMGFSFFTNAIAHGCELHRRSRSNYTIRCKTHEEFHRARAIATLQFNCHLAFLIVTGTFLYGFLARNKAAPESGYQPLNKELQMGTAFSRFTLDSDEEDAAAEITVESNGHEYGEVALNVPDENGITDKTSSQ